MSPTNKKTVSFMLLFILLIVVLPQRAASEVCADYFRFLNTTYPTLDALLGDPHTFVGRFIEPNPFFYVGNGTTHPKYVQSDLVHARYTAYLTPPVTGFYEFSYYADDAMVCFLNGSTVPLVQNGDTIFQPIDGSGTSPVRVYLTANTSLSFLCYMNELRSNWAMQISWAIYNTSNATTAFVERQEVPASVFRRCNTSSPQEIPMTPAQMPAEAVSAYTAETAFSSGFCGNFFESNMFQAFGNPSYQMIANSSLPGYNFSRLEPGISYYQSRGEPLPGLSVNTTRAPGFSVVWMGFLVPQYTTNYTFFFGAGTDMRVILNGQTILSHITEPSVAPHDSMEVSTPSINLVAGVPYFFQIVYYERQEQPALDGYWGLYKFLNYFMDWLYRAPGTSTDIRARVPASALRTTRACPAAPTTTSNSFILNSNIVGNPVLSGGQYSLSAETNITGNLTLSRSVLIVPGSTSALISGALIINNSSQFIVPPGASVSITGSLTFSSTSSISVTSSSGGATPPIGVTGPVSLSGATIVLKITQSTIDDLKNKGNVSVTVMRFTSLSDIFTGAVLVPEIVGLQSCEKVTQIVSSRTTDLSVIFQLDDSGCKTKNNQDPANLSSSSGGFPTWAIAIIVIGIAAVTGVASFLIWRTRSLWQTKGLRRLRAMSKSAASS